MLFYCITSAVAYRFQQFMVMVSYGSLWLGFRVGLMD